MRKLLWLSALAALLAAPSAVAATNAAAEAPRLSANKLKVVYGGAVAFSGSLPVTRAGEKVALRADVVQPNGRKQASTLAEATTDGAGAFSFTDVPIAETAYTAVWRPLPSATSPPVLVQVAPRIRLALVRKVGRVVTFSTKATSAIPYRGRHVLVQRRDGLGKWVSLKRVIVTSNAADTRTDVRLPLGLSRIRVLMPQSQVGTGYVTGVSRVILIRL